MNIDKADIFIIAKLGNFELLKNKLKLLNRDLSCFKNEKDKNGISLLENSLIGRNFDIAKALLELNVEINIISNEGYNELHYIAYNLETLDSFEVAKDIIKKGGDLNLKDKLYGNTPLYYICNEATKEKNIQNSKFLDLIYFCKDYKTDLELKNFNGVSIIDIISEFFDNDIIQAIKMLKK